MSAALDVPPIRLDLPPAFTLVSPSVLADAYASACAVAEREGAGALIWTSADDRLDVAVVLEPEEPLMSGRRALYVGMGALVGALASVAPPDRPLTLDWPDTVRFDGARLGGGRLGWPDGCREDEVPAWLVFSATLIATMPGEPGLTAGSTSLEEEGFGPDSHAALVEAFARYLMRGFDAWREDGFEAAASGYLARLPAVDRARGPRIEGSGDLVFQDGSACRRELLPALLAPAWRDPRTGAPRP